MNTRELQQFNYYRELIRVFCLENNIDYDLFFSTRRIGIHVLIRGTIATWLRKNTNLVYTMIANLLNRDHQTIIYSIDSIESSIDIYKWQYKAQYEYYIDSLTDINDRLTNAFEGNKFNNVGVKYASY